MYWSNVLVYHRYARINGPGGSPAAFYGALYAPDMDLCLRMRTGEKQVSNRCGLGRHSVLGSGAVHPQTMLVKARIFGPATKEDVFETILPSRISDQIYSIRRIFYMYPFSKIQYSPD